jgi:hypothetical protein
MRWVPFEMDERDLRNRVKNKMIRPTTIPQAMEELIFEQAIAKEALRLAFSHHKSFATTLKGVQQQRTIGDTFRQVESGETLVNMLDLDLLVGSGGVLSHAPSMNQTAMMMIDGFLPEGITRLAKDSIFMMPHLGVLAQVHPQAATEVFEKDCLIYLGTCISPVGEGKPGQRCLSYNLKFPDGKTETGSLLYGEMKLFPLGVGEEAYLSAIPERGFDIGAGKGRKIATKVHGGTVGIIFDGRGRPFSLPQDHFERVQKLCEWMNALKVYPKEVIQRFVQKG